MCSLSQSNQFEICCIITIGGSRTRSFQLTLQSSHLFLQMLDQCLIRHHDINLCFSGHLFCTTSKKKCVSGLLNMATCRAQSANDSCSSISTQTRLQYACQLGVSVIDVSMSSLTAFIHIMSIELQTSSILIWLEERINRN